MMKSMIFFTLVLSSFYVNGEEPISTIFRKSFSSYSQKYKGNQKGLEEVFYVTEKKLEGDKHLKESLNDTLSAYFRAKTLFDIKNEILNRLSSKSIKVDDLYLDVYSEDEVIFKGFKKKGQWFFFDEYRLNLSEALKQFNDHLQGKNLISHSEEERKRLSKVKRFFEHKELKILYRHFLSYETFARVFKKKVSKRDTWYTKKSDYDRSRRQAFEELFYRIAEVSRYFNGRLKMVKFNLKANTLFGEKVIFDKICNPRCNNFSDAKISKEEAVEYLIGETL